MSPGYFVCVGGERNIDGWMEEWIYAHREVFLCVVSDRCDRNTDGIRRVRTMISSLDMMLVCRWRVGGDFG
jgi:hypothetical protein